MSSSAVRTIFKDTLDTGLPSEKVADFSGGYEDIADFLAEFSIDRDEPWIGLQFIPGDEAAITINADNNQGRYRETGAVYIHVVDVAKVGARDSILTRAEAVQALFRGRRIGSLVVQAVTPPNFEFGATIEFEAGYISASVIVEFDYDREL